MDVAELLAVVEVDEADRVTCQAAGCNRPVFKRIHIVRVGRNLSVLGSECFKALHGQLTGRTASPRYGSADGRHLTAEERSALEVNTQQLIEQFAAEHAAQLAHKANQAKRLQALPRAAFGRPTGLPAPRGRPAGHKEFAKVSPFDGHSADTVRAAEAQAKRQLQSEMDIDPDLPGWRGLVEARMQKLLR